MTRTATPNEILEHADALRRLALVLVRDAATADDALQETLLRALRSPPDQGPTTRAWLSTVLRNIVRRGWQSEARRAARERAQLPRSAPQPADQRLERIEQADALIQALRRLSRPKREVIELRFFEGMPPRAIAERLGLPVETVKTRQKRALSELRLALDDTLGRQWPVLFAVGFGMTPATLAAAGGTGLLSALGVASMSKLNLTCCLAVLLLLGGVALLIWSRAAAMSPGGGSTAEAGPFETTPVLTFPETAAAPALQGLAREAEVSPPEARDPLQIDSPSATADGTQAIAGEVLLVAADGTAEPIREGTLHLRPEGKGESSEREVPVRDGHFTARVPKSHEPQFRTVAFGGQVAIVFEADRPELDPVDGRFTVKARVFPDTVIHVLDASTGEELPQVFLQAASHPNGAFPHPGLLSPSLPAAVASPIRYPATFERIDRSQIVYRIGAPNHAWTSLPIKPRAGREYTVKLVAGGSLTLTVTGPSLPRQARVRIRRVRGRRPVASYLVPQGGVISCEGLAPERYMARLEVGEWFDDPILLGQVQFEILAGRRSEARLEYRALAIPKSVPLAGIVHVPEGWPIAKLQMTIELLDTPLLGRAHANFTIGSGLEPVVGQPRRFRFDAGQWQAGRYQLSFRPYRYHIGLHLGEAGEPDVRVEVPARVKVRVEIEGDIGGRTSHVESLHWHCVVPKGVSMWAWHAVKRSGPKAVFEFEAPATPIMVSVGERTYYAEPLRIDVKDTGGQATLRVQPTCLLWIRAMVGEKQVGWKEDWPMRVVGLMPEGKRLTRGRESGRHFCDLSRPGRYRISLGPIPGYAPIPDLEVEVGLREPTEIRIDLQPLR